MEHCGCGKIIKRSAKEGRRKICRACRMRVWRRAHPVKAVYDNWKTNTANRGIPNNVTIMEFARFCVRTGYIYLRSIGQDMTIDRPDSTKGYTIDNMQILTRVANSRKQSKEISYRLAKSGARQDSDPF